MFKARVLLKRPARTMTNQELETWYRCNFPHGIGVFQPLLDRLHKREIDQSVAAPSLPGACPHCLTPLFTENLPKTD